MNLHRDKVDMVRQRYPAGTRIQLNSLCNDEQGDAPNIALRANCGLCGIVVGVDDQPAILMKWDNGRTLSLMPFEDTFRVIPQNQERTPDEKLYDKLLKEQQRYTKEMLASPPSKIREKAWEYMIREDILVTLECQELDDE